MIPLLVEGRGKEIERVHPFLDREFLYSESYEIFVLLINFL